MRVQTPVSFTRTRSEVRVRWGVDVGCSERHDRAGSFLWLIGAQPASFPEAWIVQLALKSSTSGGESSTGRTGPRTGRRIHRVGEAAVFDRLADRFFGDAGYTPPPR